MIFAKTDKKWINVIPTFFTFTLISQQPSDLGKWFACQNKAMILDSFMDHRAFYYHEPFLHDR